MDDVPVLKAKFDMKSEIRHDYGVIDYCRLFCKINITINQTCALMVEVFEDLQRLLPRIFIWINFFVSEKIYKEKKKWENRFCFTLFFLRRERKKDGWWNEQWLFSLFFVTNKLMVVNKLYRNRNNRPLIHKYKRLGKLIDFEFCCSYPTPFY